MTLRYYKIINKSLRIFSYVVCCSFFCLCINPQYPLEKDPWSPASGRRRWRYLWSSSKSKGDMLRAFQVLHMTEWHFSARCLPTDLLWGWAQSWQQWTVRYCRRPRAILSRDFWDHWEGAHLAGWKLSDRNPDQTRCTSGLQTPGVGS